MVGLVLEVSTRDWRSDDTIDVPAVAEAPVVAETFIERRPPTPETEPEPTPSVQVAVLDPDTRLRNESDQLASKGYIMVVRQPSE